MSDGQENCWNLNVFYTSRRAMNNIISRYNEKANTRTQQNDCKNIPPQIWIVMFIIGFDKQIPQFKHNTPKKPTTLY